MPARSPARDVIQPDQADKVALDAFEALVARVPSGTGFCLAAPDESPVQLPKPLYRALMDAAAILRQGAAVVISPLQRRLSTTEAGDLLGVSRQYLTRLIDRGEIPCDRTGRHRRLRLNDVLDYKKRRDEERLTFMNEVTAGAEAIGEYTTPPVSNDVYTRMAHKYIWWMQPEDRSLTHRRITAQVMNIGDFDDVRMLLQAVGEKTFVDTLTHAEPGWFNSKSWAYWHYRLNLAQATTIIPPVPSRHVPS